MLIASLAGTYSLSQQSRWKLQNYFWYLLVPITVKTGNCCIATSPKCCWPQSLLDQSAAIAADLLYSVVNFGYWHQNIVLICTHHKPSLEPLKRTSAIELEMVESEDPEFPATRRTSFTFCPSGYLLGGSNWPHETKCIWGRNRKKWE